MPVPKFEEACLAVLQQVYKSCQSIRITRCREPIAEVAPQLGPPERPDNWLGAMAESNRITGDITVPSSKLVAWEAEDE